MEKWMYDTYSQIESTHWWFKARKDIINDLLNKNVTKSNCKIADFGCCCGANFEVLSRYGNVTGIDLSDIAIDYCKSKYNIPLIKMDLSKETNMSSQFDYGVALDIIEHIEDDKTAVKNIYNLLNPNGVCIVTVPAYQWLWSKHDENCMHFRRYKKEELEKLLVDAGFNIKFISYYNTRLFPASCIVRFLSNAFHLDKDSSFENNCKDSLLNKTLYTIFSGEKNRIKKMKTYPFGLSLIAIIE